LHIDLNDHLRELQNALCFLGHSREAIASICNVIAAILEVGNIAFVELDTSGETIACIEDQVYVTNAANLLGVSVEKLENYLTKTETHVCGKRITKSWDISGSVNIEG